MSTDPSKEDQRRLFTTQWALDVMKKLGAADTHLEAASTYDPCCGSGGFLNIAATDRIDQIADIVIGNPPFSVG
ncbi:MAG: hypothetical protein U0936_22185 [Planctomycetaceae bacterium]